MKRKSLPTGRDFLFVEGYGNENPGAFQSTRPLRGATSLLLYHTSQGNERRRDTMRHGKKPTRKQKIRLGQAGLSPENWLVVREAPTGELVILHKHTDRIRVVPALGQ